MHNYVKLDANNIVVGVQQSPNPVIANDLIEVPEHDRSMLGMKRVNGNFVSLESLVSVKADRIALVKQEAQQRISQLSWQIERAQRHDALSKGNGMKPKQNKKTMMAVYEAQQTIEEASDQVEISIHALSSIDEVKAFVW